MRVENNIKNYLVFSGDSILDALKRINVNRSRIVFVVQEDGVLIGSVSDGDIRRWITDTTEINLDLSVDRLMNQKFVACSASKPQNDIAGYFDHKRDIIPLTDPQGRFVALARKSTVGLQVGDFLITDESPTFIVAEIGNNHNGDIDLAKRLVDLAIEANADCVKFQMRNLSDLYSNKGRSAEAGYDLGSQYTLDLLNKFQLKNEELFEVFDYCTKNGILPLCTPWDTSSLHALEQYGIAAYKVASADLTNHQFLKTLAETHKPLICSTGMSSESEIKGSIELLQRVGARYAILHCNSTYPTPYRDVNLSYIPRLKDLAGSIVGYSGHERGYAVPIAAVTVGARIIEKHFTVDRSMEGNDHKVSLLPREFAEMVQQIRDVETAIGNANARELTQGELINRENLAKSLVINCDLHKGQVIERYMVTAKSPGQGLQPNRIGDLVGRPAKRNLKAGDFFFETDIKTTTAKRTHYNFSRPYGIPVRYHDFHALTQDVDLDFVEFHLSYHDLNVNIDDYFTDAATIDYAVHAPELFYGDHILDLANEDDTYRNHSITELKRTVNVAAKLQRYFPKISKPVLVLNAGGWSTRDFLPIESRSKLYDKVAAALEEIDLSPVRLAIQTMPPFPWHFGGQSHHNLFVDPDEIVHFCSSTGHRICLDISHSMMACNYYHWDFSEFLDKVLPYTIYLHIVDAKGIDGEGVQIGHGDVDFTLLSNKLQQYAPHTPFIPEIWQGHKDRGEGFWSALTFLERKCAI